MRARHLHDPGAAGAVRIRMSGRYRLRAAVGGAGFVMVSFAGFWLLAPSGDLTLRIDPRLTGATSGGADMAPPASASMGVLWLDPQRVGSSRSTRTSAEATPVAIMAPVAPEHVDASDANRSERRSLLLVPVSGVLPKDLVDTYTHARSEGRSHDAIDIVAPRGTPVVAVAEGTVLKLFQSEQGGITLYQLDPDQRTLYYYAHLDRYASGIGEGMRLRRGDPIGYVGDTGNAGAGNYHLHFEISTTADPAQYWGGIPMNPYPLLGGVPQPRQE
jgi:peptidoglycan LD-endopeptidase LytH